jgi:hypothetical protein
MENWHAITVESDSKVCVNILLQDFSTSRWSIVVLCDDAKTLAVEFSFCSFCWVKCEANMIANTLVKFIPPFNNTVFFFFFSLKISHPL